MRKSLLAVWLLILFATITVLFWYNEVVYSMPTPVPENYKGLQVGGDVLLPEKVRTDSRPLFLHFFNPDCPCSRFNITHFKSLVMSYGEQVNFQVVVMSKEEYTVTDIQDKYDLAIPVLFDSSIAATCGVYSTPQAVIIENDKLYYRGNYNKSRYCTDKKSNYAETALQSLLNKTNYPGFDGYALKAYGCQLPTCTK